MSKTSQTPVNFEANDLLGDLEGTVAAGQSHRSNTSSKQSGLRAQEDCHAPKCKFLRDKDVAALFNVSKQTIWRWASSEGDFPRPIRIAKGTTRWAVADVDRYIAKLHSEQGGDT